MHVGPFGVGRFGANLSSNRYEHPFLGVAAYKAMALTLAMALAVTLAMVLAHGHGP